MTGATAVVWFLGRKPKKSRPERMVKLAKPDEYQEARRAVQESAARQERVTGQRSVVKRVVDSLVEVRENNHFAENIKAAMLGGEE